MTHSFIATFPHSQSIIKSVITTNREHLSLNPVKRIQREQRVRWLLRRLHGFRRQGHKARFPPPQEEEAHKSQEKKEEETPDEDLDDNSVPNQERNTTGRTGANNRLLCVSHHKGGGRKEEVPRRIGPQLIQQRVVIKRRIRIGTEIVTRGKER